MQSATAALRPRQSGITRLKIVNCGMTGLQLAGMVERIRGLEGFTHINRNEDFAKKMEPFLIKMVLLHVVNSLTSLTITRPFAHADKPLGGLHSFTSLKYLKCEEDCFIGHMGRCIDLSGMFPDSIEAISLYNRKCWRDCRCHLVQEVIRLSRGLGMLKQVTLKQTKCGGRGADADRCHDCGLTFSEKVARKEALAVGIDLCFSRSRCSGPEH